MRPLPASVVAAGADARFMPQASGAERVCPLIFRSGTAGLEILAFRHPNAGLQIVKGGLQRGETPAAAAMRELREESGIAQAPLKDAGPFDVAGASWHFFWAILTGLPDRWAHDTEDDLDHVFQFFWHALDDPMTRDWHPIFHEAVDHARRIAFQNRLS